MQQELIHLEELSESKNRDENLINHFISEKASLTKDIGVLVDERNKLNTDLTSLLKKIEQTIQWIGYIKSCIEYKQIIHELNEYKRYHDLKTSGDLKLRKLQMEYKNSADLLNKYNDERNNILLQKRNRVTFATQKSELEEDYQYMKMIREALDLKKGIPVIYTQNYLEKIRHNINALLEITFPNDPKAIEFRITDKAFDIIIVSSDGSTQDISEASQGERGLLKLTVTMGIMEETLKNLKFRTIYIDEVDSELDKVNSRIFLDILEKQMSVLNIHQAFFISHNQLLSVLNNNYIILDRSYDENVNPSNIIYNINNN
jgi:rRNA-processing protein FCF1